MKIIIKEGDGISIKEVENPVGSFIELTEELELKLKSFIKPIINESFDDIIEGATEEEIAQISDMNIPQTISQMRFRMQLILLGISIESIYQKINSIEDETMRQIIYTKFEYAQEFERKDKSLNLMAQMMELTKEQVDQIFIDADKIQEK